MRMLVNRELSKLLLMGSLQNKRKKRTPGTVFQTGASQPTLDVIKRLAVALGVTADELIFDDNERGPDDELRLQFEAISRFSPEDKTVVRKVLDSLILSNEAKRWSSAS